MSPARRPDDAQPARHPGDTTTLSRHNVTLSRLRTALSRHKVTLSRLRTTRSRVRTTQDRDKATRSRHTTTRSPLRTTLSRHNATPSPVRTPQSQHTVIRTRFGAVRRPLRQTHDGARDTAPDPRSPPLTPAHARERPLAPGSGSTLATRLPMNPPGLPRFTFRQPQAPRERRLRAPGSQDRAERRWHLLARTTPRPRSPQVRSLRVAGVQLLRYAALVKPGRGRAAARECRAKGWGRCVVHLRCSRWRCAGADGGSVIGAGEGPWRA